MFFNRKNKQVQLLPYVREDLHGLNPDSKQIIGWEISKFNIPKLWNQSTGKNVIVAVIDTGCDIDHEDLKENMLDGINLVQPNSSPTDKVGHGTHVSSTIAATNNGKGMVGIAPDTKILPIKALNDNGYGEINKIIDGILLAADSNADLITMSLGSTTDTPEMHRAIKYAISKNKVIFCAAGNSGENSSIMFPAVYDEVIAIGAVDENLERTSFTCSGTELDFLAPGDKILGCVPNNKYAMMSGTSMSNPFAVGCASLLLSYNKMRGREYISSQDYIEFFASKAIPLKNNKYLSKKYQGYGIISPCLI